MSKAILVKGGIGKVLCALPAIRRSGDLAISGGWHEFYGMAGLKAIEIDSQMLVDLTRDKDIIDADPYLLAKVKNGEWSFVQGINYLVNGKPFNDTPICDLPKNILDDFSMRLNEMSPDKPVVAINPVGSNYDGRSLVKGQLDHIIEIVQAVGATPLVICDHQLNIPEGVELVKADNHVQFAAIIASCDYLIGIDSAAMHIARARKIPGSIFFGATAGVKFYPDWFSEHRNPDIKDYSPYVQNLHLNHHADLRDNALHEKSMHYEVNEKQLRKELLDALEDKLPKEPEEVEDGEV